MQPYDNCMSVYVIHIAPILFTVYYPLFTPRDNMLKKLLTPKFSDNWIIYLIKHLIIRFVRFDVGTVGASLAYFFFLSLFPFLLFLNALIGSFNIATSNIYLLLSPAMPRDIINIVVQYNEYIASNHSTNLMSFGLLFALFSSSGAINSLIAAVNRAYGITKQRNFIHNAVISLMFTITVGFMLILCVVLVSISGKPLEVFAASLRFSFSVVWTLRIAAWVGVVVFAFVVLELLYLIMPNKKVTLRQVFPGAVFALLGIIGVSLGFSVYLNNFANLTAIHGTVGAIMALLILLYLLGIVLIIGAHVNDLLEERRSALDMNG